MIERAVVSLITILVYTLVNGWYSYVPSRHTEGTSIGSDRVSWLEQRTVNPRVASSSLATGAIFTKIYFNNRTTIPDRSFGSNHVDLGGMTLPASATANKLSIDTG